MAGRQALWDVGTKSFDLYTAAPHNGERYEKPCCQHDGMEEVYMAFQRITVNPEVCGGKPCIRGLRFPVSRLLGLLAAGETAESIVKSYPYLEREDIHEALLYAASLADEQVIEFAR